MKIECILTGKGSFTTNIGDDAYAFAHDEKGRLVAEVWKEQHVRAFLAREDAYREVPIEAPPSKPKPKQETPPIGGVNQQQPGGEGKSETKPPEPFDPKTADRQALIAFLHSKNVKFKITLSTDNLRGVAATFFPSEKPEPADPAGDAPAGQTTAPASVSGLVQA